MMVMVMMVPMMVGRSSDRAERDAGEENGGEGLEAETSGHVSSFVG